MKKLALILFSLLIYSESRSQTQVADKHPLSQIFAINYQTGQEDPATSDQAVLFKNAFIDLVAATTESRQILKATPGRKVAVIKQIDPQKLNGYQLTWQGMGTNPPVVLCTFYYNIDQNALFFYDQRTRDWVNVPVEGNNLVNLNNCQAYAKFNGGQQALPDLSVNNSQAAVPDLSVNNADDQQTASDVQASVDSLSDDEIEASVAPPELPEYDQPPCPVEGYLWQPGYWAYNHERADYYWVPGVWVSPPQPNVYWTPGYWEVAGPVYRFHRGYWGPTIGFYGGINYGFGYAGVGFVGGEWRSGIFHYNTAVVRVNVGVVHHVYVNNVVIRPGGARFSFNGRGGIIARPTAIEITAMHERHFRPTVEQVAHQRAAFNDRAQFVSVNQGRPRVAVMARITARPVATGRVGLRAGRGGVGRPLQQQRREKVVKAQREKRREKK